jgi:hypothetical protein
MNVLWLGMVADMCGDPLTQGKSERTEDLTRQHRQ